jgi:hypothetical protein
MSEIAGRLFSWSDVDGYFFFEAAAGVERSE